MFLFTILCVWCSGDSRYSRLTLVYLGQFQLLYVIPLFFLDTFQQLYTPTSDGYHPDWVDFGSSSTKVKPNSDRRVLDTVPNRSRQFICCIGGNFLLNSYVNQVRPLAPLYFFLKYKYKNHIKKINIVKKWHINIKDDY